MDISALQDPPAPSTSEPPAFIKPQAASVFEHRAARLETLAASHKLRDYLLFMSALSRAQQAALNAMPRPRLPDAAIVARAHQHAMPPLPAQSWPREALWREALARIVGLLRGQANAATWQVLDRLAACDVAELEAVADRVLRTELYGPDAAGLPFVGAALQVYWVALLDALPANALGALDVRSVCPACGFLPLGGVVGAHSEIPGLRYAHCALCDLEWHVPRSSCCACAAGEEKMAYRHIEGDAGIVQAETCESCHTYFKLVRRDRNAGADLVADDLASLALDLMVDEAGFSRGGPNLLFVPG